MVDPVTSPLIYHAAIADKDISGTLVIYGHADAKSIVDDRAGRSNRIDLPAKAFAELVRRSGVWKKGMPIEIRACNAGNGNDSLAQKLANELSVEVTAPNDYFWFGDKSIGPYARNWLSGVDFNSPGKMIKYIPQKK